MESENTPSDDFLQELDGDWEARRAVNLLGQSVVSWAQVERSAELLVTCLLTFHGMRLAEAKLISYNLGIKENSRIAIALAYQGSLPTARIKQISELLNDAQNDLKSTRNRLYHDSWRFSEGKLLKRPATGTRLQAHKVGLLVPDYESLTSDQIASFIDACIKMSDDLVDQAEFISGLTAEAWRKLSASPLPRLKRLWNHLLRRES